MISVVIPLYNKERQIAATLRSVLGQTFRDFEIVIVNDGSTDGSATEAKKLEDPRIRLLEQENAGVSAARNRGAAEAKGEFIAFLDADDAWRPDHLQTLYGLSRKYPQCGVFACRYELVDSNGAHTPAVIRKLPFAGEDGVLTNYFNAAYCSSPPLWTSAVMVRKEALRTVGGFPVGISHGEDLLTWAKLAAGYDIAYCKKSTAYYILRPGYGKKSIPVNIPPGNQVGDALEGMYRQRPSHGLSRYIGFWYKMRANLFLRGGGNRQAFFCIRKSIAYNPGEIKNYVYLALLFFPRKLRISIFKHLQSQ